MKPHRMFLCAVLMIPLAPGCSRPATDSEENASAPPPRKTAVASASPVPASPRPSPRLTPSSDSISDTVITAKTKARILADPEMAGADVSVNTDRGVVSLTGTVKSQEQAAIASAHAQRQDGVLRIDNQLAVNLH